MSLGEFGCRSTGQALSLPRCESRLGDGSYGDQRLAGT